MEERIKVLTEKTQRGEMYVYPVKTEYDRCDIFLDPLSMTSKRVTKYILNQEPLITAEQRFTGLIKFDGSVPGEIFNRLGHKNFSDIYKDFYNKPLENLVTFEWQHSVGDFGKIIRGGVKNVKNEIAESVKNHENNPEALAFLKTQSDFCDTLIAWAHKCSDRVKEFLPGVTNDEYRQNLALLADSLLKVPENGAESFYEAILSLYVCYGFIPDSIGLIDRYLYPYYTADVKNGELTQDEAKAMLQELFLMLQARIHISSDRFYRGGESHFCVGGYTPDGEDGFNELSRLIVDSLMELPTCIPQISLRWTKKTPHEVFRYMMLCERSDKNKRIAFVNDEPRIKGLTRYAGFSYDYAVSYTMIGCNELALPGGIVLGFDPINIARSVENTFLHRRNDILKAESFEDFLRIYFEEMRKDLDRAEEIINSFERVRRRDVNIVSNIFTEGPIKNAVSLSQGGCDNFISVGLLIGITTVLDSLSIVKQFVYDERAIDMVELCTALDKDWEGFERLKLRIEKTGKFFGNNDETSEPVAQRFFSELRDWNLKKDHILKRKWLFGNLIGYNQHNKFFGSALGATPDGRKKGEAISFGIGQSEGRDRSGLAALLSSIALADPDAVLTGPSVTNVMLDKKTVDDDDSFEKIINLFLTYFKLGGTHFQLTYVSKADLIAAKKEPKKYRSLRVRVSGFSDYFVLLNSDLQDEIITRTEHDS